MEIALNVSILNWKWWIVRLLSHSPRMIKFALKWTVKPQRALNRVCLRVGEDHVVIVRGVLYLPLEWSYDYVVDFDFKPSVIHLVYNGTSVDAIPREDGFSFKAYKQQKIQLEADISSDQISKWNLPERSCLISSTVDFKGELKSDYFAGSYPFPSLYSVAIRIN